MNISHPNGPRNKTMTSHPIFGLKGQPSPCGAFQGPPLGEKATCNNGKMKPKTSKVQAAAGLMAIAFKNSVFVGQA